MFQELTFNEACELQKMLSAGRFMVDLKLYGYEKQNEMSNEIGLIWEEVFSHGQEVMPKKYKRKAI